MKPIRLIGLMSLISFCIPLIAQGQIFQFTRTLKVGSVGEDVRQLQIFLNANPATRVSEAGPGSPSQESTYFGPKTFSAVIKFQQLYAQEVLIPAGLTRGTGIVGPFSRAKINTLLANKTSLQVTSGPAIESISPITGSYNTIVTITGSGFALENNKVHTGFDTLILPSPDTKTIIVPIGSSRVPRYNGNRTDLVWDFWIYVEANGEKSNIQVFKFKPK